MGITDMIIFSSQYRQHTNKCPGEYPSSFSYLQSRKKRPPVHFHEIWFISNSEPS